MSRAAILLTVLMVAFGSPALGDMVPDPESEEEVAGIRLSPVRAGRLEVNPILSVRFSGQVAVYRVGASVGYSPTRSHQFGGTFVVGNRVWDRASRRELYESDTGDLGGLSAGYLSVDEGFGSSLTGFYRFNVPYEIRKRTYPFVELFGGRDFGWGDASELGGGIGVRKALSRRTAVTTQYAYSVLFADGQTYKRHVISAGMSVFFR